MDMFDTRTMLRALEQMLPVSTVFLTTFFSQVEVSDTKYVDIDIYKGKRRLASFVSPRLQGKLVERRGYESFTYEPPYIKPKMITTAADLLKREMGQTIYPAGINPQSRAERQLGKDLAELEEQITRREEWMAAQAIQLGQIEVIGDGIEDTIDFNMASSHLITLSGTDLWTDTTNSNPERDLEDWAELILQDSGLVVDTIIMGKDAARAFVDHPKVAAKLDNLRMFIGRVAPEKIRAGMRYIGTLNSVSDIYVYHEWYYDEFSKTEKPMMDPKKVVMGSTAARCTKHYGAIQDLRATGSVPRFPKSWEEEDPSARFLMVQSAPLPVPHQIDGFVTSKVIA